MILWFAKSYGMGSNSGQFPNQDYLISFCARLRKRLVGPIAVGLVAAMLALAQEGGLRFLRREDQGHEWRMGLVGAVAEGLFLGMPAGTPGVFLPLFQLHLGRGFRGNIRF